MVRRTWYNRNNTTAQYTDTETQRERETVRCRCIRHEHKLQNVFLSHIESNKHTRQSLLTLFPTVSLSLFTHSQRNKTKPKKKFHPHIHPHHKQKKIFFNFFCFSSDLPNRDFELHTIHRIIGKVLCAAVFEPFRACHLFLCLVEQQQKSRSSVCHRQHRQHRLTCLSSSVPCYSEWEGWAAPHHSVSSSRLKKTMTKKKKKEKSSSSLWQVVHTHAQHKFHFMHARIQHGCAWHACFF